MNNEEKLTWADKVLARTLLPLIPRWCRPNHITMVRFITTPVVGWLLWTRQYTAALPLFFIVAFTDALDGALARVRGQVTEWGKLYDPLADKFLICLAVSILMFRYLDPLVGVLTIVLEITIILSALIKKQHGVAVQANLWGKIKMHFQVYAVACIVLAILFQLPALQTVGAGLLYMALTFGIMSLLTYSV